MTSLGDYEIGSRIGIGASGTVWRAFRRGPVTQVVAVKRLRVSSTDDDVNRLRREAMVLSELDHPHIVRIVEVIEDGDGIAICMQFAPGGSLEAMLQLRGRLNAGEVVAVGVPMAEALTSAHRRGIVHADVKPANILFTSDGEPLLSDFGVARTLGRLTAILGGQGSIAGTAHYMAPELLEGQDPDPRSDIYSLGIVCYQSLTGVRPYEAPMPLAVLRAADSGAHQPLSQWPDIPPGLAMVVEKAMARQPEDRFQTAEELGHSLRAALPHMDVNLPGTGPHAAPPGAPATPFPHAGMYAPPVADRAGPPTPEGFPSAPPRPPAPPAPPAPPPSPPAAPAPPPPPPAPPRPSTPAPSDAPAPPPPPPPPTSMPAAPPAPSTPAPSDDAPSPSTPAPTASEDDTEVAAATAASDTADQGEPAKAPDDDGAERRPVPPLYLGMQDAVSAPSNSGGQPSPSAPTTPTSSPSPPLDAPAAPPNVGRESSPPPAAPTAPPSPPPSAPAASPAPELRPTPTGPPADAPSAWQPPDQSQPSIPIAVDPPSPAATPIVGRHPFEFRSGEREGPPTGPITPPGGTRNFGPAPPPPATEESPRRTRNHTALLVACATLAVVAVSALAIFRLVPDGDPDCPQVEEPLDEIGVQVLEGDPEGDGCNTFAVYRLGPDTEGQQAMILTIRIDGERRRFPLGDFGDRMLLGDWNCDDVDTPAIYHWEESDEGGVGELRYYNTWPETDDADYQPDETEDASPRGDAEVVEGGSSDDGRCDRVEITPLDRGRDWTTFEPSQD